MSLELIVQAEQIRNVGDFVKFLKLYSADISRNPDECENPMTEAFLEAMAAWIETVSATPGLIGHELFEGQPDWAAFAKILLAAGVYE